MYIHLECFCSTHPFTLGLLLYLSKAHLDILGYHLTPMAAILHHKVILHKNKLIYYHISLPLWKKKLHCSIKVCRISSGILEYLVIFSNVSNSMRISVGHQHRAKFLLSILFWSALLLTLKNREKKIINKLFFIFIWFFMSHQQSSSYIGMGLPGLNCAPK